MKFSRKTNKLYYKNPTLFEVSTSVVALSEGWLEAEDTVAYPEGGGQDADSGTIALNDGTIIRFVNTRKLYTHFPSLKGFPDIQVDGIILHLIHPDDLAKASQIHAGDRITIGIDVQRRFEHSLSHSASHLLYVAIGKYRPDVIENTIGCHIKQNGARFDFSTDSRFTPEDIGKIQDFSTELSENNLEIRIKAHAQIPDARIWCCADFEIPCGGTHLSSTQPIGNLVVRRKSPGAGKERVLCEFPNAEKQGEITKLLNVLKYD